MCAEWLCKDIFFLPAESKSAKKNRKRRTGPSSKTSPGVAIEEDQVTSIVTNPTPMDPISQLQSQIAQAKADKVRRVSTLHSIYKKPLATGR